MKKKLFRNTRTLMMCMLVMFITLIFSFTAFADMLPWDNRNTDDLFIEIYTNHNMLIIDGSDLMQDDLNYVVRVFDDSIQTIEPFYNKQVSNIEGMFLIVDFDPDITRLRVELAYVDDGNTEHKSKDDLLIVSKTISLDTDVQITLLENESGNYLQPSIEYSVPKKISAYVFVNEKADIMNLKGKDSFLIELVEGYNKVEIHYSLKDSNVVYVSQFEINTDDGISTFQLPISNAEDKLAQYEKNIGVVDNSIWKTMKPYLILISSCFCLIVLFLIILTTKLKKQK